MKMTFRWYGKETDPIQLKYVKQIPGMSGLMGVLDYKAAGEVWTEEEVKAYVEEVHAAGLEFLEDLLRLLVKQLRRHLVTAQFIKQIQQLLQKGGFLGRTAVHLQFRRYFQQGFLQRQQLASGIQRHLRNPSGDVQHPITHAAETEHLRMTADGIAANTA